MEFFKKDKKTILKNILLTVAGTLVLAFGTAVFIIPFGLVSGGVSGVSIVINKATRGTLSVELLVAVFTWILFFVGLFVLGKDFAAKTLLSSFVYPLGISLFGRLTEPSALGGFFSLASGGYPQIAVMLSALFGGLLVGTGCALTFLGGGSTGGMDIVAFVLCRYFKRLKSSEAIFLLDTAVVLAGVLITKDAVLTLLGVITAFVGALAVDKIFLGASSAFSAHIVSERYEAINRAVIERLGRTTTLTDVVGGYTGRARKQVAVSFTRSEYSVLMGIVASLDKKAFVTIHRVHEIGGEGWKKLAD
ncbi:MAG: YitT family protein [Clostridia bacterium]|nr:YitT family protein [Clostridia bacterium]